MAIINKIVIQCPEEIASFWGNQEQIKDLFDGNNLILKINSKFYSKVTQGRNVSLDKGVSVASLQTDSKFLGFRVKVQDSRDALRICITELANYTAGIDSCNGNPINILDYHYCHDRVDYQQGYRSRTGVFVADISDVTGSITKGSIDCSGQEQITGGKHSSGFGFKFMEIVPTSNF